MKQEYIRCNQCGQNHNEGKCEFTKILLNQVYSAQNMPFSKLSPLDGWLSPGTRRLLVSKHWRDVRKIVEIGSWLGLSANLLAGAYPEAQIYCFDTWKGSEEHQSDPRLGTLFASFTANTNQFSGRIIPVIGDSKFTVPAMVFLPTPDLVFIDGDHSYEGVKADITNVFNAWPNAYIVGDDWGYKSVRKAVKEYANRRGIVIQVDGNGYALHAKENTTRWQRANWIIQRVALAIWRLKQ